MKKQRPLQRFSRNLQAGLAFLYCITLLVILFATQHVTKSLIEKNLYDQVKSLIHKLPDNSRQVDLIRFLEGEKNRLFFRVTLLNDQMQIVYDTEDHIPFASYLKEHYKLIEAQKTGYSYDEHFSSVALREMAYITICLNYGGHNYIMRSAFPLGPIKELRVRLQFTLFVVCSLIFLVFSILIWLLVNRLNRPLESVLNVVSQKAPGMLSPSSGMTFIEIQDLPQDFDALVNTLNSLSEQVNQSLLTLAHERNERESILRSMNEGVLSIDKEMRILYSNPAALQILGIDSSVERPDLNEIRFAKIRNLCQLCFERHTPIIGNADLPGPKQLTHLDIMVNPNYDGFVNLLVRDTSQQFELNEMRKSFVANASHELRTPITIIRGFAETLRDHPEIEAQLQKEIMQKIVNNCERMNMLITQLMNLSKIENLPLLDLTTIDLGKTVQNVIDQLADVYKTATIHFNRELHPANILGQEGLLSVVVKNLVENAIKYTDGPAKVEIVLKEHGEQIILSIRDHGIGIPSADQPYIFERFYTVDKARSKKAGGFGLGLSMVNTIVHKHGGTIEVWSKQSEGTCFTLRFTQHRRASSPKSIT